VGLASKVVLRETIWPERSRRSYRAALQAGYFFGYGRAKELIQNCWVAGNDRTPEQLAVVVDDELFRSRKQSFGDRRVVLEIHIKSRTAGATCRCRRSKLLEIGLGDQHQGWIAHSGDRDQAGVAGADQPSKGPWPGLEPC